MPLTDIACRKSKTPEKQSKLADGGGLYLLLKPTGSKLWQMSYRFASKQMTLSFGPYPDVSLTAARDKRDEATAALRDGFDPAMKRREEEVAQKATVETTFELVASEYLERLEGKKSAPATLRKNRWVIEVIINAAIGSRPIHEITSAEVLGLLQTVEKRGHRETAIRLCSTMSAVFRLAIVTLRAVVDPTTALKGAIRGPNVVHRPAITTKREFGRMLKVIDEANGWPTLVACLKIQALCFARPAETRRMEWSELDLDGAKWAIPAEKMKMRRPHAVPLSRQAVQIIKDLRELGYGSNYVFPSMRASRTPLSENAMNSALRRIGIAQDEHCSHGFRASASTLLNEADLRPEVIEAQLAHVDSNAVRRAYNRAMYWPDRVVMMQAWADMCDEIKAAK